MGSVYGSSGGSRTSAPSWSVAGYPAAMRSVTRSTAFARLLVALLPAVLLLGGCYTPPKPRDLGPPPEPRARLLDRTGGTHHVAVVHGDVWYCGFGSSLLVLDAATGRLRRTVELREDGEGGPLCDLVILEDDRMLAVLEDTAVFEISLLDPLRPEVELETTAKDLGIAPRSVREVDGTIFVSGLGGVVPLSAPGSPRLVASLAEAGATVSSPVVPTTEGPAAATGRRVHRLEGEKYLGAATWLEALPEGVGPEGGLAFVLQDREVAEVGIMGPDLRVVAMAAVPGKVSRIRVLDGVLWAVDEVAITGYPIKDGELGDPEIIRILGALDIASVDGNVFAVAGRFGRALYRLRGTSGTVGDEFFAVTREPSELVYAVHDGKLVVAGHDEEAWVYDPLRGAQRTEKPEAESATPQREAVAIWGSATIDEDEQGITVNVVGMPPFEWAPDPPGKVWTLQAVGSSLWVGHDRGLELLRFEPPTKEEPEPRFRRVGGLLLDGPVKYLFPQRVGTRVTFVSVDGGFGVVDDK